MLALIKRPLPPNGALTLPPAGTGGREVRFDHVSFAYPSRPEAPILVDFTLRIAPGERVALVGASGSGKSTLIALLVRTSVVGAPNKLGVLNSNILVLRGTRIRQVNAHRAARKQHCGYRPAPNRGAFTDSDKRSERPAPEN